MTRRDGDGWDGLPPERDPLSDAVDAYRRAFGAEAMPNLWEVDYGLAARVLRLAVARGRPIKPYLISRLGGGWRRAPPPWMIL